MKEMKDFCLCLGLDLNSVTLFFSLYLPSCPVVHVKIHETVVKYQLHFTNAPGSQ